MTIGELARKAGVNVETVRYYERRGLITRPQRRGTGFREYQDEMFKRLRFIRQAKDLGFSLKEISELLSLRRDSQTSCREVKARAENKLKDIRQKIRTLEGMEAALAGLAKSCKGRGPLSDCPILDALESRGGDE